MEGNPSLDQVQPASLEERLIALEKRVLGRQRRVQIEQNIIQNLISINNRLSSIIAGKDKLNSVGRQIEINERFIANPALIDIKCDDYLVKRELILQNEHRVREEQQILATICSKESLIDCKQINDFDVLIPKLNRLRQGAIKQFEQNRKFSDETKKLLTIYNDMMKTVKRQLTDWEARICLLEQRKAEPVDN